jgi:hypothetical protein
MGIPVPLLKNYIGQTIRKNHNFNYTVDPHAYQLTLVTCIEGGGTTRNHNRLVQVVQHSLKEAGIRHLVAGAGTISPKSIFNRAIPAEVPLSQEDKKSLDSIIPDMIIFASDIEGMQRDLIVDAKTLAPSAEYERNRTEFAYAVNQRQKEVNQEYYAAAAKLDRKHHDTPQGSDGPYASILQNHGEEGRVMGAVTGFFGEVSSDIDKIGDLISTQLAIKHQKYFRCTESHAIAISKEKIRRLWGHTMKKSWSRLVLDRLNNFVKLGAEGRHDEERQNDFNETYNFSNPATHVRGGYFESRN